MKKMDLAIIVLLVIAAGLSVALYFRPVDETASVKITNFPMEIGEWHGKDIQLEEKVYKILETRNLVMREYKNIATNQVVYLYIVASDINRRVAHPPEVCYTGDGVEILEKKEANLGFLKVDSFISRKNGNESLIFYWFKAGDKFTTSYLIQQAKSAVNQMMGKNTGSALIRVSTDIINKDKEKASQLLQEFSRKIIPIVLKNTP